MTATGAPPSREQAQRLSFHRGVYLSRFTTRLVLAVVAVEAVVRVELGDWSWWDLLIVAGLVALEPVTEWVIHVFVLHFRPRTIAGRPFDLHAARKHREHHADPSSVDKVFVPLRDLLTIGALVGVVAWLALPTPALATTATITAGLLFLAYEWSHYLIHTAYRPTRGMYRSIWRSHRLHHFRNEHYWFGVTSNLGDRLLRTYPDKSAVPLSDTARTLGITPAADAATPGGGGPAGA